MNWNPNPNDPQIFHITHLGNLPSIVRAGGLWCDAQRIARSVGSTNIGHKHIKTRRLARVVHLAAGGVLGDYVPFNFCPRSVMLYVVSRGHQDYAGGQREVVHLVSRMSTAVSIGRPWAFTDRHAELAYAEYFDDPAKLPSVDWAVMPLEWWNTSPEVRETRQAEFLLHDFFEWAKVEEVAVFDDGVKGAVTQILNGSSHIPPVVVRRDWYY